MHQAAPREQKHETMCVRGPGSTPAQQALSSSKVTSPAATACALKDLNLRPSVWAPEERAQTQEVEVCQEWAASLEPRRADHQAQTTVSWAPHSAKPEGSLWDASWAPPHPTACVYMPPSPSPRRTTCPHCLGCSPRHLSLDASILLAERGPLAQTDGALVGLRAAAPHSILAPAGLPGGPAVSNSPFYPNTLAPLRGSVDLRDPSASTPITENGKDKFFQFGGETTFQRGPESCHTAG